MGHPDGGDAPADGDRIEAARQRATVGREPSQRGRRDPPDQQAVCNVDAEIDQMKPADIERIEAEKPVDPAVEGES
jgi:hypothetical protein